MANLGKHMAFNTSLVVEKLPLKIEALAVWEKRLIVGTSEGVLLLYSYEVKDDNSMSVKLIDTKRQFAKKSITQLAVIDSINVLICLSDGLLTMHELPTFRLKAQLPQARGCAVFCIKNFTDAPGSASSHPPVHTELSSTLNRGQSSARLSPSSLPQTPVIKLCAGCKKKLILFVWQNSTFKVESELNVPDTPKAMEFLGDKLCVGYRKEYNLIDIANGKVTELFPTGQAKSPLITVLPDDELILCKDNIGIYVGPSGKPSRKFGVSWGEVPLAATFSYPYILGVTTKMVEVHIISDIREMVQSISLKHAKLTSLALGPTGSQVLFLGGVADMWGLSSVPFKDQIDELARSHLYEHALLLCAGKAAGITVRGRGSLSERVVMV